ncbi:3alpha(or 20beta)-hydroxysteroid dehydrogenase [Rhodococcus erythropolis]|uniref:SDR family NAD(P)-dependent oxidoreductase n=1 Tax=Rhodococcus erythropolis group TaxID=2840174 RepID=UPI0021694DD5|nr:MULTISPECIES: SDR family NAD(P)-dependent oxidoreductase [Rhodococcus erythropolis group]MCS4257804.1 3alpha(or 20beta)-hydroxysteroid dehydrogenase [Rhodococcus erythropolis]MCW2425105.1 3alpha(or 20beta)-hydroxysteroid dehydrogenase [Rhodococcus erythropolis]MDT9664567.1 SDR family NAD(P)-dependent oxidoreductase [Rhodococcus qingshengii]
MPDLSGKTVVVTGSEGGIGSAICRFVHDRGGFVFGADSKFGFDVTSARDWHSLLATIEGPVHGLVNCAGVTWRARVDDVEAEDLARVHAVNVGGPLLGIQIAGPRIPTGGSIVNVGSLAALTAHYPLAYTASKWSLRGLTKAAALELGPRGVRVNIVHPGFIDTPMTRSAPTVFRDASIAETPMGRAGTPDEVAGVVAFLLGDDASYVSGAEIPIDGGASSHGGVKSISDALSVDRKETQ